MIMNDNMNESGLPCFAVWLPFRNPIPDVIGEIAVYSRFMEKNTLPQAATSKTPIINDIWLVHHPKANPPHSRI